MSLFNTIIYEREINLISNLSCFDLPFFHVVVWNGGQPAQTQNGRAPNSGSSLQKIIIVPEHLWISGEGGERGIIKNIHCECSVKKTINLVHVQVQGYQL